VEVKKERIWLINQYAMPPHLESRLRTIKFAQYLTEKGYDVTIFASSVMHNMDMDLIEDNSKFIEKYYNNIHFVHIKTKKYSENGIARIMASFQFALRLKKNAKKFSKPDIIIQTATVPFGNLLYFTAKKYRAKYIVEVLDLWPESFVELGVLKKRNPILPFLYFTEKWLYKRADELVFSMQGGVHYIKDRRWDIDNNGKIDLKKVHYINNGVDLTDFEFNAQNYKLEDKDLLDKTLKKVIYIGSIRLANNLKQLIDAAEIVMQEKNIRIFLYGDGDDRKYLEDYCLKENITNVLFKEKWIEPKYVPYLLSQSDVNILNYMPGKFGTYGGSQSKMFQYMASGKPICCNLRMMYCPINQFDIGIAKEFSDSKEYADAILNLLNRNEFEIEAMCLRAKEAAKMFDYRHLTDELIKLF